MPSKKTINKRIAQNIAERKRKGIIVSIIATPAWPGIVCISSSDSERIKRTFDHDWHLGFYEKTLGFKSPLWKEERSVYEIGCCLTSDLNGPVSLQSTAYNVPEKLIKVLGLPNHQMWRHCQPKLLEWMKLLGVAKEIIEISDICCHHSMRAAYELSCNTTNELLKCCYPKQQIEEDKFWDSILLWMQARILFWEPALQIPMEAPILNL